MKPIIIFSDTQQTSLFERLIFRRENNLFERNGILKNISSEDPSLLIHLGDVCFSPSQKNILCFEKAAKPLEKLKIKKFLIPGNHDYPFITSQNFIPKFSLFETLNTPTLLVESETAIISLNSNKFRIGKSAWQKQQTWFEKTISDLEQDSTIKNILVLTHHPPFTNSSVTKDETHVQKAFLKPFVNARKTKAFISGHVHAYERFLKNGKTFIVTGGGGGPRVRLNGRRHVDSYQAEVPRPFHYLKMIETTSGLQVEVKGFVKGQSHAQTIERLGLD